MSDKITPETYEPQINAFFNIVTIALDEELNRLKLNPTTHEKVLNFIAVKYFSTNLYTFFTPTMLKELSVSIFEDTDIREFIFNLTQRVAVLAISHSIDINRVILTLSLSFNIVNDNNVYNMIPKEMQDTLRVDTNVVKTLLNNNLWLLVTYSAIFSFITTSAYASFNDMT